MTAQQKGDQMAATQAAKFPPGDGASAPPQRGVLLSCPWCGVDLHDAVVGATVAHLIACGDIFREQHRHPLPTRAQVMEVLKPSKCWRAEYNSCDGWDRCVDIQHRPNVDTMADALLALRAPGAEKGERG